LDASWQALVLHLESGAWACFHRHIGFSRSSTAGERRGRRWRDERERLITGWIQIKPKCGILIALLALLFAGACTKNAFKQGLPFSNIKELALSGENFPQDLVRGRDDCLLQVKQCRVLEEHLAKYFAASMKIVPQGQGEPITFYFTSDGSFMYKNNFYGLKSKKGMEPLFEKLNDTNSAPALPYCL
jgi:hypothetical protein